ncbi:imidazolonepropionase-like amidohydrolase [Mucilaginibacter frigoritolerans]|uniref:Imidazolonepropionase-like amidohydrolase n=1 Tax=Mucilaginibacter frigoritolerans TaxID=652788 RepID=A0A562U4F5_9SPHI|nr:amidohydrolase family protein [Mucilaginibacter frigoritolerans]TWJ00670.1 imidazolonepropionase-like amidohydrolase [Mucilaginibacter frigoritolerans]
MKKLYLICCIVFLTQFVLAQETFPVNGPWDIRPGLYAFTNANIVVSANQTITNGTLLIKDRKIEEVGPAVKVPAGYVVIDLKGKYIYPGLIDAYTTYGMPEAPRAAFQQVSFGRVPVYTSTKQGAYGWNESIKPEMSAKAVFHANATAAEDYKKNGFGVVQSLIHDGIARGTSVAVSLGDERDNQVMLNDQAAANYSFSKGTAATNYPSSLMGSIALLRQTYYDAQWYKTQTAEYNISLDAFNHTQDIPQIFETTDALNVMRANKIAKEFGKQYIFKTDGNEYRRIDAMKATGSSFIIPLTFPDPYDVEDPLDARNISYTQLKNWELAPTNPATLEKAGINFAITSFGLQKPTDFWNNLRTAIDNGLSEKQALNSLTIVPATMLGIADKVGTLEKGKMANFIITSNELFKKDNVIYENWIEGRKYVVTKLDVTDLRGNYTLASDVLQGLTLKISGTPGSYDLSVERSDDSVRTKGTINRSGDIVSIFFETKNKPGSNVRLTGYITAISPLTFHGNGKMPDGTDITWTATYISAAGPQTAHEAPKPTITNGSVIYPFGAYGYTELPKAETVLFKNATVWTNEKEGILKNADVLIENGKIKAVGTNLAAGKAKVIDATGKHLSPGIVDEHSHIAAEGGINEGTQAVTAEVRIADVLNPEDINIYRQLAGGVTTSHILHGSANPIGGQTQLIKHRWGVLADDMKFEGSDGFIKFALGENVKGSNNNQPFGVTLRYPQTRMGVEQVYVDEFTRAKEYKTARAVKSNNVRRDLELDAIVEILDNKRFITCHSYVQSELNMLMHVADSMGFRINTFTHILEGYKVADKMKARNIAGSTFSDWWAYKNEVAEAIPYNGAIMHEEGIVVAFNSDDEEMARRLNQEAGKAVAYGHVSEEEAFKFVTLNPAKMLHIDKRVGSIKVGKDADLVLWSTDPLSIYAVAEKTYVDGIPYWDIEKDAENQKTMKADEARIIQKMIAAKNKGSLTQKPPGRRPRIKDEDEDNDDDGVGESSVGATQTNIQTQNNQ